MTQPNLDAPCSTIPPTTDHSLPGALYLRGMLGEPPAPYDFVLPGLPLAKCGTLVAPGGTGKSTFLWQVSVGVATGRNLVWPKDVAVPSDPAGVLVLSAEDEERDVHHRLTAIIKACNLSAVEQELLVTNLDVRCVPGLKLVRGMGQGQLVRFLFEEGFRPGQFRLIVGDPLARLAAIDENNQMMATTLVETTELVAREFNASLVLAHHVNKSSMREDNLSEAHASRGASALTDGFRWQCNLSRCPERIATQHGLDAENRKRWLRLTLSKANYTAPMNSFWLRFQSGGVLVPAELPPAVEDAGSRASKKGGGNRAVTPSPF